MRQVRGEVVTILSLSLSLQHSPLLHHLSFPSLSPPHYTLVHPFRNTKHSTPPPKPIFFSLLPYTRSSPPSCHPSFPLYSALTSIPFVQYSPFSPQQPLLFPFPKHQRLHSTYIRTHPFPLTPKDLFSLPSSSTPLPLCPALSPSPKISLFTTLNSFLPSFFLPS